jgi:nucleotide-binding universal stress UspA family protein
VDVATSTAGDASVGEAVCVRALEQGADLLVLGAYGHSRMTEFVFGGVKRHVLRDMTTPVLFSR